MMPALEITAEVRLDEPAYITATRLRARRRVLWLRMFWGSVPGGIESAPAISDGEVDRHLLPAGSAEDQEAQFYATDPEARQLAEWIAAADQFAGGDVRWSFLRRDFGLSQPESDLLALVAAAELYPALRRVYAYLADDPTAVWPTALLASQLFQWPQGTIVGPESALAAWRIVRVPEGAGWSLTSPCQADPHIVRWLAAIREKEPPSRQGVTWMRRDQLPEDCLYPDVAAAMRKFIDEMRSRPGTHSDVRIELVGLPGSGKRTLSAQVCAALGADLMAADAVGLIGPDVNPALAVTRVIELVREARLNRAILYWDSADMVDPVIWKATRGRCELMLAGRISARAQPAQEGEVRRSFRLPALTFTQRAGLWKGFTGAELPEELSDWILTPAELSRAAVAAGHGIGAALETCRQMLYQTPGELFTPLPCTFTWEDIVLPESLRAHLKELEDEARLRRRVYDDWGFAALAPLGRGLSALFAGPSGTGKTMAVQVIARSLGRELYRVDLAGLVNKYIGETEKRLKLVFDACERSAVILFFDEADALFGQRTQVKDAHDRFANIQIDYLLQRMEQFDGIAILATNRKADLDTAFLRRLRFIIDFLPPGVAERRRLWKIALPERSPSGEEILGPIDWDFLAGNLNMTGADIKSAALAAAFRARAEDSRITMTHVLAAARREMAKHGMVLRAGDLGN
jgi:SpoVK/Ycf46/Vps4 family AAA+-type ATPase